jgi:ankyrin repeat protein
MSFKPKINAIHELNNDILHHSDGNNLDTKIDIFLKLFNSEYIDYLIGEKNKDTINDSDINGWTLLHYICAYGNLSHLHKVLDIDCININAKNKKDQIPLHILFSKMSYFSNNDIMDAIKLFMCHNVDLYSLDYKKRTLLHVACSGNSKMNMNIKIEVIKFMIIAGIDVEGKCIYGKTALHHLCEKQNYITNEQQLFLIKLFLDQYHANIECIKLHPKQNVESIETYNKGYSPIHIVASELTSLENNLQIEAIKEFIDRGANLEAIGAFDFRVIHIVCSNITNLKDEYKYFMIKLLIDMNVNLEVETSSRWRPIHYLSSKQKNMSDEYHYEITKYMLSKKININAKNEAGTTPLIMLCCGNKKYFIDLLRLYIQKGANINDVNNKGLSPLHCICSNPNIDPIAKIIAFNIMMENGANVNIKCNESKTPLHYLCHCDVITDDSFELFNLLIQYGANMTIEDVNGNTPIHILCKSTKIKNAIRYNLIGLFLNTCNNVNKKNKNGLSPSKIYETNNSDDVSCKKLIISTFFTCQ